MIVETASDTEYRLSDLEKVCSLRGSAVGAARIDGYFVGHSLRRERSVPVPVKPLTTRIAESGVPLPEALPNKTRSGWIIL